MHKVILSRMAQRTARWLVLSILSFTAIVFSSLVTDVAGPWGDKGVR
jgi:hypothetical protein